MLFASGLSVSEGPVLLPDGNFLCADDIPS